jgi:hypothetical protein
MCHGNYGYGYLQALNATHLHWSYKYAGFGTPQCPDDPYKMPGSCEPPDTSSWPETAFKDELWLIQEHGHGVRAYDAPSPSRRSISTNEQAVGHDTHEGLGEVMQWSLRQDMKETQEMLVGR